MKQRQKIDLTAFGIKTRSPILLPDFRIKRMRKRIDLDGLLNGNNALAYDAENEYYEEEEFEREESGKASPFDRLAYYQTNWREYITEWLGINATPWPDDSPPETWTPEMGYPLWSKQVEILDALQRYKKVAVKSCHGPGKTFTAALASLTMFLVLQAVGITTANTFRQVRRGLWGEIHKIYNRANNRLKKKGMAFGGQLNQTSLEMSGKWYMEGFSTDDANNYMGFHARRLFLILDEAGLIGNEVYDAVEGILTSEESYVLAIGNPIDPTMPFKQLFEPGSGFHQISISVFDTPNLRHDRIVYPELVSPAWEAHVRRKYGKKSAYYVSRALGEFPEESEDALITLQELKVNGEMAAKLAEKPSPYVTLGVDVARNGPDLNVIAGLRADGLIDIVHVTEKKRTTETVGRVKHVYHESHGTIGAINVDDIGVGGGVSDQLFEADLPVNEIVVNEAVPEWDAEAKDTFLNKRAYFYNKLVSGMKEGKYFILDEEARDELNKLTTEYTSGGHGKMKIMDKNKFRTLHRKSPNKADACMLAVSEEDVIGGSISHI